MNFRDRLMELMNVKGVTAYDINKATGISQSTIGQYKNNPLLTPTLKILKKLADYFEVDERWLRTGEGEPFTVVNEPGGEYQTLNTQEMISRLIIQNDRLIAVVERHSITIENLSRKVQEIETPKIKT